MTPYLFTLSGPTYRPPVPELAPAGVTFSRTASDSIAGFGPDLVSRIRLLSAALPVTRP